MSRSVSSLRAVFYAFLGYTIWVGEDAFMKLARDLGASPGEVLGGMGLSGVLVVLAAAGWRRELRVLWPTKPRQQAVRAVLASLSIFSQAAAIRHLPLTMFYIVNFSAPILIAAFGALLLHERLSLLKAAAIIAGFLGVVIAVDPFGGALAGDRIGYAIMAVAVGFFVANALWLRLMTQHETFLSLLFFTACMFGVTGTIASLTNFKMPGWGAILAIAGAGLCDVLGNLLNFAALRYAKAATVAQFHYSQIVIGAGIGYLVWGDVPSWPMAAGAALIIGTGLYIAVDVHKEDQKPGV